MTPEQLDAVDLDAIRERVRHATPGPWYVTADGGTIRTDRVADRARGHRAEDVVVIEDAQPFNSPRGVRDDDAEFMAAARTDVPALLAEITRLRAALHTARCDERERCAAAFDGYVATAKEMGRHHLAQVAINLQGTIRALSDDAT